MRILYSFIVTIGILLSQSLYSQCIPPQWQDEGLSSYCYAIEVMESPLGGFWVAFWGSPKEIFKETLLRDSVDFIETDSSIIFDQDIISRHELIFNRKNRLCGIQSFHKFLEYTSYGWESSKRWRNRYEMIFDKREITFPYGDNGIGYKWDFQDDSGNVNIKLTTEVSSIYYLVNVFMSKEL
jgi:hypothetical protein